jgi:hypothetical protein
MEALLLLIEAERVLRSKLPQVRDDLPELWSAQVEGVQAERQDPKWQPKKRLTLADLLPMLAPHKGQNKALNFLPHYPDEYRKVIAWAACFFRLVQTCEDVIASAVLQLKGGWEWPI